MNKLFPCKNRELGCLETMEEDEVIAHEETCEHRVYICPVLESIHCDWLGTREAILAHCRNKHANNMLENPCNLTHHNVTTSLHNYIINAFHKIFLLHTKVCMASGKIYHAVRLLETSAEAANYFFNLDIKRNNEQLTKEGEVVPQGCLAIQESTSLAVNMNSLLDMLGGFDGVTFTLTVRRKVSDVTLELVRLVEKCAECAEEVTVFRYRDESGWRCESCAPARRACKNQSQGCTHNDIDSKCSQHEDYFCQQATDCYLCWTSVSQAQGSLSAHYNSMHQDIIHRAGSTWRAKRIRWQYCLLLSVVGTAVCLYRLRGPKFELYVRIPVLSERLHEFRCEVRITDPYTGHARTFTPTALYETWHDWFILLKKEEFSSWNTEFDVCVDIKKAES